MHHHGYLYEATHGTRPRWDADQLTPGGILFDASPFPPEFMAHWLQKPRSFIKGTWDTPADAARWASDLLRAAYGGEKTTGPSIEDMYEFGVESLQQGKDICFANPGVAGHVYTEIYVICCPNEGGTAPCPIGRQDARPEGATQMTGIP